jgi:DNA polymerase-1
MKTLILDGYNLFYRARFAVLKDSETTTVFNFFRSLRLLVETLDCDKIFLVLEGYPKKRFEQHAEYKGTRVYADNSDNFKEQRKQIVEILHKYFPIQIVKHDDYECDDIIAYLARLEEKNNNQVTIVSSDTDFIQLISDNVALYNPVKKEFLPKIDYDYVTFKSLKGDSADNIEGFAGIGVKKAEQLTRDQDKLNAFLSEGVNLEKFKYNVALIAFHILTDEDIQNLQYWSMPVENTLVELRQVFTNLRFYSLTNNTSWLKFAKTFEKYFHKSV